MDFKTRLYTYCRTKLTQLLKNSTRPNAKTNDENYSLYRSTGQRGSRGTVPSFDWTLFSRLNVSVICTHITLSANSGHRHLGDVSQGHRTRRTHCKACQYCSPFQRKLAALCHSCCTTASTAFTNSLANMAIICSAWFYLTRATFRFNEHSADFSQLSSIILFDSALPETTWAEVVSLPVKLTGADPEMLESDEVNAETCDES